MSSRQARKLVKKAAKARTLAEQGGKCFYCEAALLIADATWDHVVPKADGGSTHPANVVVACHTCNRRKGQRTARVFFDVLDQEYEDGFDD